MPTKDLTEIKNNIISFLEENGPSLPARIAREIQTDMIFASAFLSELYSEKKIKITNMKVGSSPIYFLKGQEEKLENFASEYLKSKEKVAFEMLKEKKLLKDSEQEPAIRVALREIKDFAIPERKEDEIYWKYYLEDKIKMPEKRQEENEKEKIEKKEDTLSEKKIRDNEKIGEEKVTEKKRTKPKKKKTTKKKSTTSKDEKFFNNVKEYLKSKDREIEDIINFNKSELILKIKENEKEKIVIAFNKKRVTEADITKVYKKISDLNLEYYLLSLGEPAKKTENLIDAIKKLDKIEKFE